MSKPTTEQLTFRKEDPFEQVRRDLFNDVREGSFAKGMKLLNAFLEACPDPTPWVYESMKLVCFWANREQSLRQTQSGKTRSRFLQDQWRAYETFVAEKNLPLNDLFPTIRQSIHERIMQESLVEIQHSSYTDVESLLDLAGSMQVAGQLDKAVETLRYALRLSPNNASVLLLLSEVYAELGHDKLSQHALRELFFWNASQGFEVRSFSNPKIVDLLCSMRELGFAEKELVYWLPIYARMKGVLGSTFPLKPKALERVLATVKQRELSSQVNKRLPNLSQAVLANSYLYLIEHYRASGGEGESIVALLKRKIALASPFAFRGMFGDESKEPPT